MSGITKKYMEECPMYTVFHGTVDEKELVLQDEEWDLFTGAEPTVDVLEEAAKKNIRLVVSQDGVMFPQRDDQIARAGADDLDAALAFLRAGGQLVKLPDDLEDKYWRAYVVLMVKRTGDEDVEYPWQANP